MPQNAICQALQDPGSYPHPTGRIEHIETHISHVFVAGDWAYKLKKPVNLGFLNFSTLDKRRLYCHEEVRLNRRLAETIYLGVVCIVQDPAGGYAIEAEGDAPPERIVEYAVKMRAIPRSSLLESMLSQGLVTQEHLKALADTLVRFHESAATGERVRQGGEPATIRANVEENFEQTRKDIDVTLSQRRYTLLKRSSFDFLERCQDLLQRRIDRERIRECHGDLRADHVCFLEGEVSVVDCIEFNERFRFIDVACDVAFLAMDLDFRGCQEAAEAFTAAYLERSGDRDLAALLPFYQSYYAYARGKVEDLRLRDRHLNPKEHEKMLQQAAEHFDLSLAYAARPEQPALLVMCGLSGTGKSRLAADLARSLRAERLRSDVLRKELHGLDPGNAAGQDYDRGLYAPEATRRTYERLLDRAGELLRAGRSVTLDATFQTRQHREQARQVAREAGAPFLLIECRCPEDIVLERLRARSRGSQVSDADTEIYRRQKQAFEPVQNSEAKGHILADTSLPPRDTLVSVLEAVLELKLGRAL